MFFMTVLNTQEGIGQSWLNSNFINGNGTVFQIGSSNDNNGHLYIFGYFDQTVKAGNEELTTRGQRDLFLAKFDPDLEVEWIKTFGGTGLEFVQGGIVIGPQNNIYVASGFRNNIYFSSEDSLISDGMFDSFLACYSSEGDFLWAKNIARGTANQRATQLAIDKDQNLLVAGFLSGTTTIGSRIFTDPDAFADIFLATFDQNGNFITAKQLPVKNKEGYIFGLNTFGSTYYFTGIFADSLCLDIDTIVSVNSTYDAFIYATNTSLEGQWVRTVSGFGDEYLYAVTNLSNAEPIISGYSNSTLIQFDSTSNQKGVPLNSKGSFDIFLVHYDINGNLLDKKNYGGLASENSYFSKVYNDEVHLTGFVSGNSYWDNDTLSTNATNDRGALYARIGSDFNVNFTRMINSTVPNSSERSNNVISYNDRIYLIGTTNADSLILRDKTHYNDSPGLDKTFIVELGCLPISLTAENKTNFNCNIAEGGEASISITGEGGFTQLLYSIDGGETFSADGNFTITEPGEYNIVVKDSAGCELAGSTLTITQPEVFEIVSVDSFDVTFNGGDNGSITLTVTGGTEPYEYVMNEGAPQASADFTGLTAGSYRVVVQDANNCGPLETDTITIEEPPVGLQNLGVESVNVYPNPVSDQLNFEFSTLKNKRVTVTILDASGKVIISQKYRPVNGMVIESMDVSDLNEGVYFIRIGDEGEVLKVIKR